MDPRAAVVLVAHPALHAERSRTADDRLAEPGALDVSVDRRAHGGALHPGILPD
jgi:hypothetical protein